MLRPRPFQLPHPPLLRSVASEASLSAQARQGRPVIMAAATAKGAARNIEVYRKAASEAGISPSKTDEAIAQCWVARTVARADRPGSPRCRHALFPRDADLSRGAEHGGVRGPRRQGQRATEPAGSGRRASETMLEDFTSLAATESAAASSASTGPMPAEFSTRALKLFMQHIAPEITKQRVPA
ncbi:MAG: hypothetical protein R3D69_10530 [Xanthobacteraceae bacterium]